MPGAEAAGTGVSACRPSDRGGELTSGGRGARDLGSGSGLGEEESSMKRLLLALLLAFAAHCAWADCDYSGKRYSTGAKVGGRTCQSDGSWR